MVADVLEPERGWVADELSEDTVAAWQIADLLSDRGLDAARDEPLQLASIAVEDSDRGVAGAGQLAGDPQELLEDGIDLGLRNEAAPGVKQPLQSLPVEPHGVHAAIQASVETRSRSTG
jgi:hypothetical protein